MSIKRTKQYQKSRREDDGSSWASRSKSVGDAPQLSWEADVASQPDSAFAAYSPKSSYQQGSLLLHASFGKGIVARVDGNRLEILFQDGTKKLVHAG